MSDVARERAERLTQALDLDAIVMAKPESYAWATGCPPGVAAFFRRAGAALALLPASSKEPIGAVVTELFAPKAVQALGAAHVRAHADWVETADIRPWLDSDAGAAELVKLSQARAARAPGFSRPALYDARAAFEALCDLLRTRRLLRSRIGLDLDFWPVADFHLLKQVLPGVQWVDASAVIAAIKAVKSEREIAKLKQAAALAEAGMRAAIAMLRAGVHRDAIAAAWRAGVAEQVLASGARLSGQWEYITVGPLPWSGGAQAQRGDVIKFDVGCLIDGYSSDSGRTFSIGPARPRSREIMAALYEAFQAGLEALRPGRLMSEVHARATMAMHQAGFAGFTRGHFGHSLGHDTFCETAPFIAAQAHEPIEPGMVLAFETPYYVDGEGGFIIEDQFLITATGAEPAWTLPRGLQEIH